LLIKIFLIFDFLIVILYEKDLILDQEVEIEGDEEEIAPKFF